MAGRAEWMTRVGEWKASGETAEVFARRKGLKAKLLQWWASRFVREAKKPAVKSTSSSLVFARVEASSAERVPATVATPVSTTLDLVLPRGCAVRVTRGFDRELLLAVVDALEVR